MPAAPPPPRPRSTGATSIFIVNRNRHEAMVRLVDWLRAGGTRRIVILDNASTYPPLLQYYDALPKRA